MAQVGSGGRAGGAAGVEGALGGGQGEGQHHLVEAAVAGGGLAAGAGGGEAADGGPLVGLREVAEGEAVFGEQRLRLGAPQAGLQGGGAGDRVEVEQPVHAAQVEGDERAVRLRGEAADDGGAAAERHGGQAVLGAQAEHGQHLLVRGGQQDGGGQGGGEVAAADAQQVGCGLAAGVADAGLGVGADVGLVAQGGGQCAVRGGCEGARGDGQVVECDGCGLVRLDAEQITQQPDHRVGQRGRLRRVAPAAPQHVHDCRVLTGREVRCRRPTASRGVTL
ncbi:hypothetical protein LRR80_03111 [Streptomyces sp. RO-S4]|nr:hypothetical protein [Streptomyces sp. RO-S4]